MQIDVDGDGSEEWIYVSASGSSDYCYVRHACFAILMSRDGGFSEILNSMGSTIAFFGDHEHAGYRDLLVTGANSASGYQANLFVWSGERYDQGRAETCSYESAPSPSASPPADLCSELYDEIVLQ